MPFGKPGRLVVMLFVWVFLLHCGETSEAHRQLSEMGLDHSPEAFVEAARRGHVEAVELFLETGMDPEVTGSEGYTPLIRASAAGREEVARVLLDEGARVDGAGANGTTPLLQATWNGRNEVVRLLLIHGADINQRSPDGLTPLMLASAAGHELTVHLLLGEGADLEMRSSRRERNAKSFARINDRKKVMEIIEDYQERNEE